MSRAANSYGTVTRGGRGSMILITSQVKLQLPVTVNLKFIISLPFPVSYYKLKAYDFILEQ